MLSSGREETTATSASLSLLICSFAIVSVLSLLRVSIFVFLSLCSYLCVPVSVCCLCVPVSVYCFCVPVSLFLSLFTVSLFLYLCSCLCLLFLCSCIFVPVSVYCFCVSVAGTEFANSCNATLLCWVVTKGLGQKRMFLGEETTSQSDALLLSTPEVRL